MSYPTYLVHFNKNHDSKNGQFTFGDGDGDGLLGDHYSEKEKKQIRSITSTVGSSRTQKAFLQIDRSRNAREARRNISEYEKSARNDEKEALKLGDEKAANLIRSGRMYYKALLDSDYQKKMLNKAILEIGTIGMDEAMRFTYEMVRDIDNGGLKVIFNNDKNQTITLKD